MADPAILSSHHMRPCFLDGASVPTQHQDRRSQSEPESPLSPYGHPSPPRRGGSAPQYPQLHHYPEGNITHHASRTNEFFPQRANVTNGLTAVQNGHGYKNHFTGQQCGENSKLILPQKVFTMAEKMESGVFLSLPGMDIAIMPWDKTDAQKRKHIKTLLEMK